MALNTIPSRCHTGTQQLRAANYSLGLVVQAELVQGHWHLEELFWWSHWPSDPEVMQWLADMDSSWRASEITCEHVQYGATLPNNQPSALEVQHCCPDGIPRSQFHLLRIVRSLQVVDLSKHSIRHCDELRLSCWSCYARLTLTLPIQRERVTVGGHLKPKTRSAFSTVNTTSQPAKSASV